MLKSRLQPNIIARYHPGDNKDDGKNDDNEEEKQECDDDYDYNDNDDDEVDGEDYLGREGREDFVDKRRRRRKRDNKK